MAPGSLHRLCKNEIKKRACRKTRHYTFNTQSLLHGVGGVDGGAEDAQIIGGGEDFKAAALERAHFHNFVYQPVEHPGLEEFGFQADDGARCGAFDWDVV